MTNYNKQYNKTTNNNENVKLHKITIHKNDVIGETEKSILVTVHGGKVWINKKGIYVSNYSNYLTKYIPENFKHTLIKQDDSVLEIDTKHLDNILM